MVSEQIISTRGAKIRGLEGSLTASAGDLAPLASTHVLFNDLVTTLCNEIFGILRGGGKSSLSLNEHDARQEIHLQPFLRVAFRMSAAEGDHLLSRLLSSSGADFSDRQAILGGVNTKSLNTKSPSKSSPKSDAQIAKFPLFIPGVLGETEKELAALPRKYRAEALKAVLKILTDQQHELIEQHMDALKHDPFSALNTVSAALRDSAAPVSIAQSKSITASFSLLEQEHQQHRAKLEQRMQDCWAAVELLNHREDRSTAAEKFNALLSPLEELRQSAPAIRLACFKELVRNSLSKNQSQVFEAAIQEIQSLSSYQDIRRLARSLKDCGAFDGRDREALVRKIKRFRDTAAEFEPSLSRCINLYRTQIKQIEAIEAKHAGVAPWRTLGCSLDSSSHQRALVYLSSMPGSWQRQILKAAIEALKSNINLEEYVADETRAWKLAQSRLESIPHIAAYRAQEAALIKALGDRPNIKQRTAQQLVAIVEQLGFEADAWRGNGVAAQTIPGKQVFEERLALLRHKANAIGTIESSDTNSRKKEHRLLMRRFRDDLTSLFPEHFALLRMHQNYVKLTGRQPEPPTLTIPHKFDNPKHVMWEAAAYRAIELPGEGPQRRGIRVKLPLLVEGSDGGVVEVDRWYTVTGDPRLMNLRRAPGAKPGSLDGLEEFDRVTQRWVPIQLGGIRMVPAKRNNSALTSGDLSRIDFKLKVTIKREQATKPKWVADYVNAARKGTEIRSSLPEKLLVVSIVPDTLGEAKLQTARVITRADGSQQISYGTATPLIPLKEAYRTPSEKVPVASPAEVLKHRTELAKVIERRLKIEQRFAMIPADSNETKIRFDTLRTLCPKLFKKLTTALPEHAARLDIHTPNNQLIVITRQQLGHEIQVARRMEQREWRYITNLGEDRANAFSGSVARHLAGLSQKFPGHEIAVVIESRQERSGSTALWSKAFNALLSSAAGSKVHGKLVETLRRLDLGTGACVAVIERPLHGLLTCSPAALARGEDGTSELSLQLERTKDGAALAPYSHHSIVVSTDSDLSQRIRAIPTNALLAQRMIELVLFPQTQRKIPAHTILETTRRKLWTRLNESSIDLRRYIPR